MNRGNYPKYMNIVTVLLSTVAFFGLLGGMVFLVVKQLNKSVTSELDSSTGENIETAQEFLPFKKIRDGVIDLGGHDYRAIIECSSTNYNLKTDSEKEIIELSFQRFLNSLTFPVTIFIQTKILDNSKLLETMKEELIEISQTHPQMEAYANSYFNEMSNLSEYIGNNKQKKKYIIVPYNEALELGRLSNTEKYDYSVKEIQQRALMLNDGLSSMGVKGKLLDTKGLAELVYSTYHKDNFGDCENIVNGEFLSLIVEGEKNPGANLTNDKRADWILYEAQMRLKNELVDKEIADYLRKDYEEVIKEIEKLREDVGKE